MDQNKKTTYRISFLAIFLLIAFSGLADLLSLIPFVGIAIGPIYWILAAVYFWKAGLGILNWRRAVPSIVSVAGEFIPAIQALPTIITATIVIIAISRAEDKTGMSLMPAKAIPGSKRPLNAKGMRAPENEIENNRNSNLKPLVVDGMRRPMK